MIQKSGALLATIENWEARAGPKRAVHWQDARSAKECARAWLGAAPDMPTEVRTLMATHTDIGSIERWCAEPEVRIRFDSFRGEPANIDVLVVAHDGFGPLIVAVEATGDEPFGARVCDTLRAAERRRAKPPRSQGIERLNGLTYAVLGRAPSDAACAAVRYQLLTATAAAMCVADLDGATRAVLLVHEFVTDRTSDDLHARNRADLDAFVGLISGGAVESLPETVLMGPFRLPGEALFDPKIRFYVGKAARRLSWP